MIYEKIVAYCKKNNLSIMAFEQKCGLANGVVGKWRDDKLSPSLGSLSSIAEATGIPISDWLREGETE